MSNNNTILFQRAEGCLLGLAVGDCLGVPLEFRPRDFFPLVTEMVGGGAFRLPIGAWTDDTSMALCLGYSLLESRGFNAIDQLKKYCAWCDQGYCSSTGECFDIGKATLKSLIAFQKTGQVSAMTSEHSAGNGSTMRLAPIPIFYHDDKDEAIQQSIASSATTHAHPLCLEGCALLGAILWDMLQLPQNHEVSKQRLLENRQHLVNSPEWQSIVAMDYQHKHRDDIISSGYVVDSLEAALWAFWHTDSFEEALILVANLAGDSDTVAAICGQLAGAYYGVDAIPQRWLKPLFDQEKIRQLARDLVSNAR